MQREHPVEAECGKPAAVFGLLGVRGFPIEAAERDDETVLCRTPVYVGHLHDGVLQVSRDDLDIVLVEGDELQRVHGDGNVRQLLALRT